MAFMHFARRPISRRTALKVGFAGLTAAQLALIEQVAKTPIRASALGPPPLPDIQFDIGAFIQPAVTLNDGAGDVVAQFGPVFSTFTPAQLTRTPVQSDQTCLENALQTIESVYPFSPSGVFVFVSYGIPFFNRLPGGIGGALAQFFVPHLLSDPKRLALEEAVPSPTDVVSGGTIVKDRFDVPVTIEQNDLLFHMRSDSLAILGDVLNWLEGSNTLGGNAIPSPAFNGLINFQETRLQFVQIGMPRQVADQHSLEFAPRINPDSPMFFGFLDQQVDSSGPPQIVTFVGNGSAAFTDAKAGDYFDNGSIAHLSHDIEDAFQFYSLANQDPRHPDGEPFTERIMYMFRANQLGTDHGLPNEGNADQFTDGGGPAYVNNIFQGTDDAALSAEDRSGQFVPGNQVQTATFTGLPRIGHEQALQRSSRAADGTPVHIRMDGPGFDGMDVPQFEDFPGGSVIPAGTPQPKLQFLVFVPTADFFTTMRANVAAQDLQAQFHVAEDDNGLERFITATRRQHFLVPPRRHRSFPLTEFCSGGHATIPKSKKR
jgi:hypothetical protein